MGGSFQGEVSVKLMSSVTVSKGLGIIHSLDTYQGLNVLGLMPSARERCLVCLAKILRSYLERKHVLVYLQLVDF